MAENPTPIDNGNDYQLTGDRSRELRGCMYFVYVLWSQHLRKRYVGCTKDLDRRLKEHNAGKNRFTKGWAPWMLLHREVFGTLSEATRRESFLKSGAGRAWLDEELPAYRRAT